MASTSTSTSSKQRTTTQKSTTQKSTTQASQRQTSDRKVTDTAVTYVRETGQRAVDVPVGAVLTASERVNGVVQPWTSSDGRNRELKELRSQVRTELSRFERRGVRARRQAIERARRGRGRVTERVRSVPATISDGRGRIESGLRKAGDTVRRRGRGSSTPSTQQAAS